MEFFQGMELNESRRTSSFKSILALCISAGEREREENGRVTRIFLLREREREEEYVNRH